MAGWHQTIIIGNVGRDPEMKYLQSGQAVCSFSVAVGEVWYDKNTNEKREKTTWYRVSCWRKMAETANQYVHKGMQIMITGNVEARGYTNNAGEVTASLEITARDMKFLGGRRDGDQGGGGEQRGDYDDFSPPPSSPDDIPF
jgi:single-strand DNA-binding protein